MRSGRSWGVHDSVCRYDAKEAKTADEFVLFPTTSNKVYGEATATNVDPVIKLLSDEYKKNVFALFLPKSEYDTNNASTFDGKPMVKFCNLVKTNDFKKIISKGANAISWSVFKNKFRDMSNWSFRGMPDTMMELAKVLNKSHIISTACENLKSIIQDDSKCFDNKTLSILRLAGSVDLSDGEGVITKEIESFAKAVKSVIAKYPLILPVADEYNPKQHASPLAEYIGFIDSKDANKK
jgi:hypothetical protein